MVVLITFTESSSVFHHSISHLTGKNLGRNLVVAIIISTLVITFYYIEHQFSSQKKALKRAQLKLITGSDTTSLSIQHHEYTGKPDPSAPRKKQSVRSKTSPNYFEQVYRTNLLLFQLIKKYRSVRAT